MSVSELKSGCANCGIGLGHPKGCKSNGGCSTGGCNKLNTYNWLSDVVLPVDGPYDVSEVSFNQGSRKGFFRNERGIIFGTGDLIVVEAERGYDIGLVSLSGELVRLQMKKKKVREDVNLPSVLRVASDRDLTKMDDYKKREMELTVRARVIARSMDLSLKISSGEYQADGKRITFYFTADHRVDFREYVRKLSSEFHTRVELRQIGVRQEAGKIGGIGSCGRELCCSTWLTDFRNVSTSAARYQQLSINQAKLSGQCGRLKCCLNYELDTYMDALSAFPRDNVKLKTQEGVAHQVKVDIFRQVIYYSYPRSSKLHALTLAEALRHIEANEKGQVPETLTVVRETPKVEKVTYSDQVEHVSLAALESTRKRSRKRGRKPRRR